MRVNAAPQHFGLEGAQFDMPGLQLDMLSINVDLVLCLLSLDLDAEPRSLQKYKAERLTKYKRIRE